MTRKIPVALFSLVLSLTFFCLNDMYAQDDDFSGLNRYRLSDFNGSLQGWFVAKESESKIVNVMIAKPNDVFSDPADRVGRGNGVLKLDLKYGVSSWESGMIKMHPFEADWSKVVAIQFDVYLEEGGPNLFATPFIMSDQWSKWSQDKKQTPLTGGEWVTVTYLLKDQENIDATKISALGLLIWGPIASPYEGSVYVDNIVLISKGEMYAKPVLPTLAIKSKKNIKITIDPSKTGGEVSSNLISLNFGGNMSGDERLLKYLKYAGPGGLFRSWSFGDYGNQMQAVNPSKGKYNWKEYDAYIKDVMNAGWKPLITLGECPFWNAPKDSSGKPNVKGPPLSFEAWAQMAADFVFHYNKELGLGIKYWEIWNEPDLSMFWQGTEAEYNQLVKLASEAMKKVDPSITILAGAWANPWSISARVKSLLREAPKVDVVSYHNYLTSPKSKEQVIFKKIPTLEAPVYKNNLFLKDIAKELQLSKVPSMMVSEMNITADINYDPRIETMLYAMYWGSALYHYVHQNLDAAVYFDFANFSFGLIGHKARPVYYVFPLLMKKAMFPGSKWLKVDGEAIDLKVLALKKDNYLNIVVLNTSQENVQYDVSFDILNPPAISEFYLYRLDDKNTGEKTIGKVPYTPGMKLSCPPYSISVLKGKVNPEGKWPVLAKYTPAPSLGALGLASSGQFVFNGEKAMFSLAKTPVKLDGSLVEYASCQPIKVGNAKKVTVGKDVWQGTSDASAEFFLMYDAKNLYVAGHVADDVALLNNQTEKNDVWNGDGIEFLIGTKYNHNSRDERGEYDYQLFLIPAFNDKGSGVRTMLYSAFGQGTGIRSRELLDSAMSIKRTGTGYDFEARISIKNFPELASFKSGDEFRFDIGLNDADVEIRDVQLYWNAEDGGAWNNPDFWGVAKLK